MDKFYPRVPKDPYTGNSVAMRFRSTGICQGWWNSDGKVLAAVSGGSDSIAMLFMLRFLWRGKLVVAHLDHGFRQETALRDASFVEKITREWGLECFIEHLSVPSLKKNSETLEEAGRRERYSFLEKIAERTGANFIATGHTADDSAETVFLNLLRGTGIRGIRGIPRVRGKIVRPIIECSREELQLFLKEQAVPWVTDESNEDVRYYRNRIRHQIFPYLEREGNPCFRKHLVSLGTEVSELEILREDQGNSLASWLRLSFPFTPRAWRKKPLESLDPLSLQSLFASEGRDIGLSPLSRTKTGKLIELVLGGKTRWRFQWEKGMEICGSKKMVALVDRDLFSGDPPQDIDVEIDGEGGSFIWGSWIIYWEVRTDPSFWRGDFSCSLPLPGNRKLSVSSLASSCPDKPRIREIPWWGLSQWPLIRLGNMFWVPLEGSSGEMKIEAGSDGCALHLRAIYKLSGMKGDLRHEL